MTWLPPAPRPVETPKRDPPNFCRQWSGPGDTGEGGRTRDATGVRKTKRDPGPSVTLWDPTDFDVQLSVGPSPQETLLGVRPKTRGTLADLVLKSLTSDP